MNKLEWNDGMSVGVKVIDNDHKKLILLIAALSDAVEEGKTTDIIMQIFDELTEYVTIHFKREEALMRQCDYDDYDNHLKQHHEFAEKVPELKSRLLNSDSIEVALEVNLFLFQWVINHILIEDMSYAQPVFEHGLSDVEIGHETASIRTTQRISQHIRLGWRMLFISLIPITAMVGLVWMVLLGDYQEYKTLKKLESLNLIIYEINRVTHHLQEERALTTGYISSDYTQFIEELDQQRSSTDQAISDMVNTILKSPVHRFTNGVNLEEYEVEKLPHKLELLRNSIQQKRNNPQFVKESYTEKISTLLSFLHSITNIKMDNDLSNSIIATTAILNLKESIGQERALGMQGIEMGYLSPQDFHLFIHLIGQQNGYLRIFRHAANQHQTDDWVKFNTSDIDENLKKAEKDLFNAIKSDRISEMDRHQWFNTLSQRMDQLEGITAHLVAEFQEIATNKIDALRTQFYSTTALLIIVSVLTIMISWVFNRSIILPLQKITTALKMLAQGDRHFRFTQSFGNDELGNMINAYEQCRRALLQADVTADIRFRRKDIDLLQESIKKSKYEELASIDPLTGALNRRKFDELAQLEVERVRRYHHPLSIMMLDIDHFKKINDTYGHANGDIVLQQFVKTCLKIIRKIDILSRIGGEEFVILLPEADKQRAVKLAERIRLIISELIISTNDTDIAMTVSIGVTEWSSESFSNPGEMIKMADEALYKAKNSGRNRVFF